MDDVACQSLGQHLLTLSEPGIHSTLAEPDHTAKFDGWRRLPPVPQYVDALLRDREVFGQLVHGEERIVIVLVHHGSDQDLHLGQPVD